MAQKQSIRRTRSSSPPPSMTKSQEKAFGRLINAYRDSLRSVVGNSERSRQIIKMAREMRGLFEPSKYGPLLVKEGLAAYALGVMACLTPAEARDFMERASGKIRKLMEDQEIEGALVYAHLGEENAHRRREIILGFGEKAEGFLEKYFMIAELDTLLTEEQRNFEQLYAEPLSDKEYPVPVLVAHQLHTKHFGMPEGLSKEEQLAKSEALKVFHYSMAETLGMTSDTIAAIGRVATETELAFGSGEDMDRNVALYTQCQKYLEDLRPFAEEAQKVLVGRGGLASALKRVMRKHDWKIKLESQTINPNEVSRQKSASRMYKKIKEKQVEVRPEFGPEDVKDIVGITLVIDRPNKRMQEAEFQDANIVANALVVELKKNFGQKINVTEIKTKKRKTGYAVPHLKLNMQIKMNGETREVPVEIQVRTRKIQDECTKGVLSRGKKVGGIINDALIQKMAEKIRELSENVGATITRNSTLPEPIEKEKLVVINVVDLGEEKRNISKKQVVIIEPGECVAGAIALIEYKEGEDEVCIGFEEQVKACNKDGKPLGHFDEAPPVMMVELGGLSSQGINYATCCGLMKKVVTLEAQELLKERRKYLKSLMKE